MAHSSRKPKSAASKKPGAGVKTKGPKAPAKSRKIPKGVKGRKP